MSESLCHEIKKRISLQQAAVLLGIDLPNKNSVKFRSPFRPDQTPSCTVKGDLFTDWSTGEHLDQISFFARAKRIPVSEAVRSLAEILRVVGETPNRAPEQPWHDRSSHFEEQSRKRAGWPPFHKPTSEEMRQIAELRGLSVEGISFAAERGFLNSTETREGRAWVISDASRRNAQARRLDGKPWEKVGAKAWTMPGSEASWPVGLRDASAFPAIALCEGGPDLLAAMHLAWVADALDEVAPVAMLGASHRIPPNALPLFARHKVRIFGHTDKAGQDAAERWAGQLVEAGSIVEGYFFDGFYKADGTPVKDLNDFCHIDPNQWESLRERIECAILFSNLPASGKPHQII